MTKPIAFPHPLVNRPYEACSAIEKSFFRETIRLLLPYTGKDVHIHITDGRGILGDYYRLKATWAVGEKTIRKSGVGVTPGEAQHNLMGKVRRWTAT